MRRLLVVALLALMPALVGGTIVSAASHAHHHAAKHRHGTPAPVSMRVDLGYNGQYRTTAWMPVRVTVHNRTGALIQGMVEIPDRSSSNNGPAALYHTLYRAPLVLPGGATKQVTLYVPGYDGQSLTSVSFAAGGNTLKTTSPTDFASAFDASSITVGVLATDPQNSRWVGAYNPNAGSVSIVNLTSTTLDPMPAVLANFDVIALTNTDASHLRDDQIRA
ncbi:MAG TPA: hypothetical protein VF221_00405, partial [Chloroflexota bacterium]